MDRGNSSLGITKIALMESSTTLSIAQDPESIVPQLRSHHITFRELHIAVRVLEAVASLKSHTRKENPPPTKIKTSPAHAISSSGQTHDELPPTVENTSKANDDVKQRAHVAEEVSEGEEKRQCEFEDGLAQYRHKNLRSLRKSLAGCFELHKRTMFNGKDEETHYENRILERSLKRQKMAERDIQKKRVAATALRRGRMERLKALQDDAKEEEHSKLLLQLVPDGHVQTTPQLLENGTSPKELPKMRSCYVCKVRFREIHHFYDQMCPPCASLNWEKRHQTANLRGRVAVVTGSRVKIGFQTCLKLLRAGCIVVATTRFPNAAVMAYRSEPDFDDWKNRLQVYGLDLRDVSGLEAFARFLKIRYGETGIDILINNACQTIRRPAGYYLPAVEQEQAIWKAADETHREILSGCREFERLRRKIVLDQGRVLVQPRLESQPVPTILPQEPIEEENEGELRSTTVAILSDNGGKSSSIISTPFDSIGLSHSAAMSQMIILPEDAGVSDDILPRGISDINGQQVDFRATNSWLLRMEEVSTPEVLECMFVNAIAPFVLNSRLKPLMAIPTSEHRPNRFIINVSAMEGKFYRYKMPNHPHTNMAKAALNMLTRTSAEDLAQRHRIYMNSVDTGWINDENPLEKASKIAETNLFQTPIDEIDAAARILDPIFNSINHADTLHEVNIVYGKFLKDYRETEW